MRFVIPSIVIACLASCWAAGLAPAAPVQQTRPPSATAAAPTAADNEAAAKHAKRTLCRKQAKSKKLVGAHKTTYIKDCMSAP